MSTEKDLAVGHSGFWHNLLPLSESFIRLTNKSLERHAVPLDSSTEPARRGLVNEAGFQIFAKSFETSRPVTNLLESDSLSSWTRAYQHIRTMRQHSRTPIDEVPLATELKEAIALANRIEAFFVEKALVPTLTSPPFLGCGWISQADGDVLVGDTLFEIKAGQRDFRSVDLFQTLIYCALNFASKTYDIAHIGLLNPRAGTNALFSVSEVCLGCGASSEAQVLDEIVGYISEPFEGLNGWE